MKRLFLLFLLALLTMIVLALPAAAAEGKASDTLFIPIWQQGHFILISATVSDRSVVLLSNGYPVSVKSGDGTTQSVPVGNEPPPKS